MIRIGGIITIKSNLFLNETRPFGLNRPDGFHSL